MKYFLLLIAFMAFSSYGATCTTTTRTNYSTGQVLTSTSLNADFNQLVAKVNGLDGGCITDGTLEASALNSSDFTALNKGISRGCNTIFVDANTIGVDRCLFSVNGNQVQTTTQTNVTWGCSGCSAELNSTTYYVYAKNSSSSSTINLLISTTGPLADGFNDAGDKVIAKFYNSAGGNIREDSIEIFDGIRFVNENKPLGVLGTNTFPISFFVFTWGDVSSLTECSSSPCTSSVQYGSGYLTNVTRTNTGRYDVNFSKTLANVVCVFYPKSGTYQMLSTPPYFLFNPTNGISTFSFNTFDITNTVRDSYGVAMCWTAG